MLKFVQNKISFLIFTCLLFTYANAQNGTWGVTSTFCKPFVSDVNSTISSIDVGVNTNRAEYDIEPADGKDYKIIARANVGVSFPVYAKNFDNNKYGFAVSVPIHFFLWLDVFEKITAPVVNTDYNIGGPEFKFIQRFEQPKFNFLKSYSLKFIPFYHQSTHIGDEITIYREMQQLSITRVNVSYDYTELSLWINEPELFTGLNHSFRFGFMYLVDRTNSWYTIRPEEGDVSKVIPLKRKYEWYLQYQLQTGKYFLSSDNLQNILSVELRNRPQYNYPYYNYNSGVWTEVPGEGRGTWSTNLYFGWRVNQPVFASNHLGFGFKFYYGLTPYGQFRNKYDYMFAGVSLVLE